MILVTYGMEYFTMETDCQAYILAKERTLGRVLCGGQFLDELHNYFKMLPSFLMQWPEEAMNNFEFDVQLFQDLASSKLFPTLKSQNDCSKKVSKKLLSFVPQCIVIEWNIFP